MEGNQQKLMRHGERIFRVLVDTIEDYAICAMDIEGRIASWNPGAVRIYGYEENEAIGQSIATIFTEEDRRAGLPARELRNAALNGRSESQRWHVRKNGSRLWALGVLVAVHDGDGTLIGFGKIISDRTDLKELQDALTNRASELEQANEDKSIFLATLVHELRGPLAALSQGAELLQRSGRVDQPMLGQMIGRQVRHMKRLVDDLMEIMRVGRGKLQLQRVPIDLREVITRAAEMVRPEAEGRAVSLDVSVPELPVQVSGDRTPLLQVFSNLLSNAVKFSKPGALISTSVDSEGNDAVVRVLDHGAGIPPDRLASIFDLFSQAHPDLPASGLGIGLALAHDLVSLHDGTIQARSEGIGKGSEFIVRLPLLGGGQHITPASGRS